MVSRPLVLGLVDRNVRRCPKTRFQRPDVRYNLIRALREATIFFAFTAHYFWMRWREDMAQLIQRKLRLPAIRTCVSELVCDAED